MSSVNHPAGKAPTPPAPEARRGSLPKLSLDHLTTGGGWGLGDKFARLPNREEQLRDATKTIYSVQQGSELCVHESDVSSSDDGMPYGAASMMPNSAAATPTALSLEPLRSGLSPQSSSPPAARVTSSTPAPAPAPSPTPGSAPASSNPTSAFALMMQRRMAALNGSNASPSPPSAQRDGPGAAGPSQSQDPPSPRPHHHTQMYTADAEDDDDNTFIDYGPRGGAAAGDSGGLPQGLVGGGRGNSPTNNIQSSSRPLARSPPVNPSTNQNAPSPSQAQQQQPAPQGKPPMAPPSVTSGVQPSPAGVSLQLPFGISGGLHSSSSFLGTPSAQSLAVPQLVQPPLEQIYDARGNWRPGTIVSSLMLPQDLPFRTMAMAEAGVGGSSVASLWVSMGNEPISMFELSGCELNAQRTVHITEVSSMAVVVVKTTKKQPVGEKFKESRAAAAGSSTGGAVTGFGGRGGFGATARGRGGINTNNTFGANNKDSRSATLAAASILAHQKQQTEPQYEESAYLWCGTERGALAFVDMVLFNEDGVISNAHNDCAITFMYSLPQNATGGTCSRVWTCSARDRQLRVWDGATRRPLAKKVLTAPVTDCVAIPADVVAHVWTSSGEASVRVWDYDGKERTHSRFPPNSNALRFKAEVRFMRYHAPSQLMWVCCVSCIMLVNPKTYEVLQSLPIVALALEFGVRNPHTATIVGFTMLDGKARPTADTFPSIITVECPFSSGRIGNDASFALTREMVTVGQRIPDLHGLANPVGSVCLWPGIRLFGGDSPFAAIPHAVPPRGLSHISIFTTEACEPIKGWGGGLFGAAPTSFVAPIGGGVNFPSSASAQTLGNSGVFGALRPPRAGSIMGGSVVGGRPPFPKPSASPSAFQAQLLSRGSVVSVPGGVGMGGPPSTHSMVKPLSRGLDNDRDGQSTEGTFVVRDTPHGSVMGGIGGGGAHAALLGGGPPSASINLAASGVSFNNSVVIHSEKEELDRPQWMAMLNGPSPSGHQPAALQHSNQSQQQQQQQSGAVPQQPSATVVAAVDPSLARNLRDLTEEVKKLKNTDQLLRDFTELSSFAQSQKFNLITVAGSSAVAEETEEAMAMAQRIGLPRVEGPEARVIGEVLTYMTVRTMLAEKERAELAARCALLEKALESSASVSAAVSEVAANHFGLRSAMDKINGGSQPSIEYDKRHKTVTIPQELFNAYLTASVMANTGVRELVQTYAGAAQASPAANSTPAHSVDSFLPMSAGNNYGSNCTNRPAAMGLGGIPPPPPSTAAANFASPHSPSGILGGVASPGVQGGAGDTSGRGGAVMTECIPVPRQQQIQQTASLVVATANVRALQQLCTAQSAHVKLLTRQNKSLQSKLSECETGLIRLESALVASLTTVLGIETKSTSSSGGGSKHSSRQEGGAQSKSKKAGRQFDHQASSNEKHLDASNNNDQQFAESSPLSPIGDRRQDGVREAAAPKSTRTTDLPHTHSVEERRSSSSSSLDTSNSSTVVLSSIYTSSHAAVFREYRKDIEKEIRKMRGGGVGGGDSPIATAFGHASNALVKLVWMARQYGVAAEKERSRVVTKSLSFDAPEAHLKDEFGLGTKAMRRAGSPQQASIDGEAPTLLSSCAAECINNTPPATAFGTTPSARAALVLKHTAAVAQLPPSHVSVIGSLAPRDKAELLRSVVHPCLASISETIAAIDARRTTALDTLRLAYEQGARLVMDKVRCSPTFNSSSFSSPSSTSAAVNKEQQQKAVFIDGMLRGCDVTSMLVSSDVSFAASMAQLCLQEAQLAVLEATIHELTRWEEEEGAAFGSGERDGEEGLFGGNVESEEARGSAAGAPTIESLSPAMRELNKPLVTHHALRKGHIENSEHKELGGCEEQPSGGGDNKESEYADPQPHTHAMRATLEEMERCSSGMIGLGVEIEGISERLRSEVASRRKITHELEAFVTSIPATVSKNAEVISSSSSTMDAGTSLNSASSSLLSMFPTPSAVVGGFIRLFADATHPDLNRNALSAARTAAVVAWTSQWRLRGCLAWGSLWVRFVAESLRIMSAVVSLATTALPSSSSATADHCSAEHKLTAEHICYLLDLLVDWRSFADELDRCAVGPLLSAINMVEEGNVDASAVPVYMADTKASKDAGGARLGNEISGSPDPSPSHTRLFSLYLQHVCRGFAAVGIHPMSSVPLGVSALAEPYPAGYGGPTDTDPLICDSAAQANDAGELDNDAVTAGNPNVFCAEYIAKSPAASQYSPEAFGIATSAGPVGGRRRGKSGLSSSRGRRAGDALTEFFDLMDELASDAVSLKRKLARTRELICDFESSLKQLLKIMQKAAATAANEEGRSNLPSAAGEMAMPVAASLFKGTEFSAPFPSKHTLAMLESLSSCGGK